MGKLGDVGPPSPEFAAPGRCPFLICVSAELPACAPVEPREVYLLPSLPHFRAAGAGMSGFHLSLSVVSCRPASFHATLASPQLRT